MPILPPRCTVRPAARSNSAIKVAVVLLVWIGVVNVAYLKKIRPYVTIGFFVVGMILTPPDIFSQTLLAVPMWMLFEIGKAKAGELVVVDALTVKDAKTSALRGQFGKLGWAKPLIIGGPEVNENFGLAARNIPHVDVLPNAGLNVYDILRADKLVLTKAAIEAIEARFSEKEAA